MSGDVIYIPGFTTVHACLARISMEFSTDPRAGAERFRCHSQAGLQRSSASLATPGSTALGTTWRAGAWMAERSDAALRCAEICPPLVSMLVK